jgi:hypothetical protein
MPKCGRSMTSGAYGERKRARTRMNKKIKNISRAIPLAVALGVILIAAFAITSAQAEPPPITIDCTFYRVALGRGYSQVKVAPKDMAWLKPGDEPANSEFDPDNQRNIGFVVLGRGIGPLTASTDLRKLTVQLAQVASDHGANAINYQILNHGTQMHVQFLRVEDSILQKVGHRPNPSHVTRGANR